MSDPETLRTYASILEKPTPMFDPVLKRNVMRGPAEILQAAIEAMRFRADMESLADRLEKSAHEGAQSMTEMVVAMAMQDAKDADAVRRAIELVKRYGTHKR